MKRIAACVTCSPSTSLRRSKRIDSTITTRQLRTNQLLKASSLKRSSDGLLTYTWFRNTWNTVHTYTSKFFYTRPKSKYLSFGAAFSAQVFQVVLCYGIMLPYYMNLCLSDYANCVSLGFPSEHLYIYLNCRSIIVIKLWLQHLPMTLQSSVTDLRFWHVLVAMYSMPSALT